jgi:hypothetical protein
MRERVDQVRRSRAWSLKTGQHAGAAQRGLADAGVAGDEHEWFGAQAVGDAADLGAAAEEHAAVAGLEGLQAAVGVAADDLGGLRRRWRGSRGRSTARRRRGSVLARGAQAAVDDLGDRGSTARGRRPAAAWAWSPG